MNETAKQTLKREVIEESGYEIDNIRLFTINDNPNRPNEDRQNVDFIFIADGKEKIGNSDSETLELKWFDIDNLPEKETVAFDHYNHLELYKKYLKEGLTLPILN